MLGILNDFSLVRRFTNVRLLLQINLEGFFICLLLAKVLYSSPNICYVWFFMSTLIIYSIKKIKL
jgi:hypothetical protein